MSAHPLCCSLSIAFCHSFHRFSSFRLASRHDSLPGSQGALRLNFSRHDASFSVDGAVGVLGTLDGAGLLTNVASVEKESICVSVVNSDENLRIVEELVIF